MIGFRNPSYFVQNPVQLHASLLPATAANADAFVDFCRAAEETGFASVHVPIADHFSEAFSLVTLAGSKTTRLSFRIGWSFDGILKSLEGRALYDTWLSLPGRLILHVGFEPGQCDQNDRFAQAAEFLENCKGLFKEPQRPSFEIEGASAAAAFLAVKHADCLWRPPDRPNQVYADALPVLHFGKQVGLLASAIARNDRAEALEALSKVQSSEIDRIYDPASWLAPWLWKGQHNGVSGASAFSELAFAGSIDEIARALCAFKTSGVSHFLIREWPVMLNGAQELLDFGAAVLPKVRELEVAEN
jgi:hypothetical protein